jgi:hypothetical protein
MASLGMARILLSARPLSRAQNGHWSGETRNAKAPALEANNSFAAEPAVVKLFEHLAHAVQLTVERMRAAIMPSASMRAGSN